MFLKLRPELKKKNCRERIRQSIKQEIAYEMMQILQIPEI